MNGRTGEAYIGNESPLLIPLFGSEQEVLASVENLGGHVDIEDRTADGVYISVAGTGDTVIEHKPSFSSLDRCSASSDLKALPPLIAPAHDVAVLAPISHVGAL